MWSITGEYGASKPNQLIQALSEQTPEPLSIIAYSGPNVANFFFHYPDLVRRIHRTPISSTCGTAVDPASQLQ